ncbi:MAG: NF038122 family metalloprotease [Pirellulaceae bacterium]
MISKSCLAIMLLLAACPQVGFTQVSFNISGTGNANADAAFQRAADFISSQFSDSLTINLTTGFSDLGGSILGQAGSTRQFFSYSDFRNAVNSDITSLDDLTFSSSIPQGNSFSVYINETMEAGGGSHQSPYVDSSGVNTSFVRLTTANAKSLGLISGSATGQDVSISFNDQFTWDFDPSDGITTGAIDFVGVAIHEIMHGMGFISGVDILDSNDDGQFHDDELPYVSSLDFTRFSADALNAGADIDWTADNRPKFYSIDGGLTPGSSLGGGIDHWSRGVVNGDGRQASHWRDGLGLGVMDPTSAPAGFANIVTELDLQALDVIGWNRFSAVPEGSAFSFVAVLGMANLFRRRRRR